MKFTRRLHGIYTCDCNLHGIYTLTNSKFIDIIYAKYLEYRTGSGQRLRKIKFFILDILSTENTKQAIIDESEVTEVQDNINLDIETLSQIDNQFNFLEIYHSALISSQLFGVPVNKTKQHLYTLEELSIHGKAKIHLLLISIKVKKIIHCVRFL